MSKYFIVNRITYCLLPRSDMFYLDIIYPLIMLQIYDNRKYKNVINSLNYISIVLYILFHVFLELVVI